MKNLMMNRFMGFYLSTLVRFLRSNQISISIRYPLLIERPFSITPGVHVHDVEIVVQRRMRIGMKILFTDGTPLVHRKVDLSIKTRDLDGHGSGGLKVSMSTDARGYLERYVNRIGFYTVSVEYNGVTAMSEEFLLNAGERREGLILQLPSDRR